MKRWMLLAGLAVVASLSVIAVRPDPSFAVQGSFILWDQYPGKEQGQVCTGERSLYHDINASTHITVETDEGEEVTSSALGQGRIASGEELATLARRAGAAADAGELDTLIDEVDLLPCLFRFEVIVDTRIGDSADFVIRVGRRGQITMSESDLRKPGAVQLSVGLR